MHHIKKLKITVYIYEQKTFWFYHKNASISIVQSMQNKTIEVTQENHYFTTKKSLYTHHNYVYVFTRGRRS